MQLIEDKMLAVFGGNMGAYGQDTGDGSGGMRVDKPLNAGTVRAHLQGTIGIGCYPSWHQDGVLYAKWGCCDIDTGDWSEAYALATALRSMGLVPHVERSRSKGWHVWIFATKKTEAKHIRRALKVAYAAIELPAKEANPKSETLHQGQVGNYVRLPYKGGLGSNPNPERQTFMGGWDQSSDGTPVPASDWFYEFDQSFLSEVDLIEYWADKYREPERVAIPNITCYTDDQLKKLVGGLRGDLLLFVKNGPTKDRSGALVALAFKLKAAGYDAQEIYNLIVVADNQWGGKYSMRPNANVFYEDIVSRVL